MKSLNTDHNEYIITLDKTPMHSFLLNDEDYKYICSISIANRLGSKIFEIKSNDIEILQLIDNIETFLNHPSVFTETFFYFITPDNNMIYKCIEFVRNTSIDSTDISKYGLDHFGYIQLKLFDYIDEMLIPVTSIDLDNSIEDLLNSLYEEFIIDDNTGNFFNENMSKYTTLY